MQARTPAHARAIRNRALAEEAAPFYSASNAGEAIRRAQRGDGATSQSDAMLLQRTIGNQAVGRLLQRAPTPVVQRVGEDDEELPPMPSSSGPLLLTDRPWEQIERERNPLHQMARQEVFGEDRSGLPRPTLPQAPIQIEGVHLNSRGKLEETPKEPELPPMPSADGPLLLTDKPWKEIVGPRLRAERKKRRDADRDDRAEERTQFLESIRRRVAAVRALGEHSETEAAEGLEGRFSKPQAVQGLGDRNVRNSVDSELAQIEGPATAKSSTRKEAAEVVQRIRLKTTRFSEIVKAIGAALVATEGATFDKTLSFFDDPGGEKEVVTNNRALLTAARLKARGRMAVLKPWVDGVNDPTDPTEVGLAKAAEVSPDDAEVEAAPTKVEEIGKAAGKARDFSAVKKRKEDLIATYKLAPYKLLPHVGDWLLRKYLMLESTDKTGLTAEILKKLSDQRNVPKRVFLKDVLGYTLVERPKGRLYLRHVQSLEVTKAGKKSTYEVHISVFADTVTAGTQDVSVETKEDITDTLLAANTDRMRAAHVTLELFPQAEYKRNPHWYRGGPWDQKDLAVKADDAPNDVRDTLADRMDDEIDRTKDEVEDVITAGGSPAWPELK